MFDVAGAVVIVVELENVDGISIRDRGVGVSGWSPAPGAKQCVLRVLGAIVEEISYENRFRVVEIGYAARI